MKNFSLSLHSYYNIYAKKHIQTTTASKPPLYATPTKLSLKTDITTTTVVVAAITTAALLHAPTPLLLHRDIKKKGIYEKGYMRKRKGTYDIKRKGI